MRLALHIWSESLRHPALAEFVVRTYGRLKAILVIVARRARDHGDLPPDADPEAVGVVLLGMIPGYALHRILTGGPEPDVFKAGLPTLLARPAG